MSKKSKELFQKWEKLYTAIKGAHRSLKKGKGKIIPVKAWTGTALGLWGLQISRQSTHEGG